MTLPAALPPAAAPRAGLPVDDAERRALHDEVHARPPALVPVPAEIVYVAVLNEGVSREDECAHLRRLPGQSTLPVQALQHNYLRLALPEGTLKWERHSEFTRYSWVTPSAPAAQACIDGGWLGGIPGRTVAAIRLSVCAGALDDPGAVVEQARAQLSEPPLIASLMGLGQGGQGHSIVVTNLQIGADGFEHLHLILPALTTPTRAGRVAARLLELETYRLMALRGLPVAKALAPVLGEAERALADITARLEGKRDDDAALLDTLVALAARVERATAEHMFRFSATQAYAAIVHQRIDELREQRVPGAQTIGEFMQRRLSPAIATVAATAQRLGSLSQRVERAGALLRTRVDIEAESHSRQLLEKLTRGQALQLRLQSTVEGLSIAAISYYMVSLILYAAKAAKAAGLPIHPELAAGASIPLVLWAVAWLTRRVHMKLLA